jgi:hypothetical protein
LACDQLTYVSVDASAWVRVKHAVGDEYGITIESDSGEASSRGFTLRWSYVASEQTLEVQCLQKPFLVPCSVVNKRIEDTAARCRIEPS